MKVTKRKLSPRTASILIALGGVAVLAAGMFLVVLPQRSKASDLRRETADVRSEITRKRAESMRKVSPIHVAELFKLVQAMPDKTDMPGILLQLNDTARGTGITFDSISPQPPVNAGDRMTYPIHLEFTGNFYDLNDFVYRLRNLTAVRRGRLEAKGRLFSIDAIEFGPGGGGFPTIAAKLTVNAYTYGAQPVPGAPAPAAPPTETETAPTGDAPPPDDATAVASG